MLGLPTSVTAPNGTVTNTAYDSDGRVTQTSVANAATLLYNYSNGNLSSITRTGGNSSQIYNLDYDDFGNTTSISVGDRTLASYAYNADFLLETQTDGNGDVVTYTYDKLGRVKTATYSDGLILTYTYTGEGSLYSVTTEENNEVTTYIYNYDSLGRLVSSERQDGEATAIRARQEYDTTNRVVRQAWQLADDSYDEYYTYNSSIDGSLNTFTTATGQTLKMNYDGLRRLTSITGGIYGKSYTYRNATGTKTTMQVASVAYDLPTDQSFAYTYDNMGNIATYTDVNGTVTYTYDAQGQLLSASDGTTTYSYMYDTVGNILEANGHSYTYDDPHWKDLLTAVDNETISYDASGNPTSYYNGTRWTFGWEQGRRLTTATNGTTSLSYTYDADGLRTSKTVDGVKHTYYYASGKLLRETYGSNTLDFFYDASGNAYALKYNGTVYYYITNLQGDVMSIVDAQGTVVASYEYDPYGNIVTASGTLAEVNPIRYRGYYFDSETGMYYLQSRYYDPELGRFINADALISTGQGIIGYNMFAYCGNNPVLYIDNTGTTFLLPPLIAQELEELEKNIEEYLTPSNSYGAAISGSSITISAIINSAISAVKSAARPANIGIGTYAKTQAVDIAYLRGTDSIASKLFNILAYGAVAIDVYYGVEANISNDADIGKIAYDAAVDILVTGGTIWAAGALGSQIGAAAGSVVPGAGNVIGGIAGFVIGVAIYVTTDMIDYNGKTGREWLKGAVG